jgi:DNA-binding beta-propeller fold protein YncE
MRIEGGREVKVDSGTKHNLRAASINPAKGDALIVGNAGSMMCLKLDGSLIAMNSLTTENLRAVRWNATGSMALIAGNNGTLINYDQRAANVIDDSRANLRCVSWRQGSDEALITSNCFAEEFIPSPNLFKFEATKQVLKPVSEGRSDIIGVDWNPDGKFALVVGYDVVWHTGFIARFDDTGLHPINFENDHVYPVTVAWDATGKVAAIATSVTQPQSGQGRILLWDGQGFRELYRSNKFFFSQIAWSPVEFKFAAIASTEARTFDT